VAGDDGLAVIREVIARAEGLLRIGGRVVIEHSDRQGESCPALLNDRSGWTEVADHPDLAGRPRCTVGRWSGRA
jgi:release factor glutamine methyltransferase